MVATLLLALALDLLFGEPPNRWHPVAWIGRLIVMGRAWAPTRGPLRLIIYGALLVIGLLALVVAVIVVLTEALSGWAWGRLVIDALLLKLTFSLRGLFSAVNSIQQALIQGNLEMARRLVGWHLVSRPTHDLSTDQVVSATVESLAENLTDSVVAPLFFYLLLGLPGAWAFRVINTADSMLGYRDRGLEYLGKASARLDDLVNWIPARIAALTIVLGAFLAGESGRGAWQIMWRDHKLTASPNAGWTMAAMAGALAVTLEKPGAYRLGGSALPTVDAIPRAKRVAYVAVGCNIVISAAILVLV
ncbi:MAG TPA: cobalamin biosynthesis protein [Methylomirabilota bacterium]|nr:cobalamin biosynthesis protein [Methylomirabilota bacterium]